MPATLVVGLSSGESAGRDRVRSAATLAGMTGNGALVVMTDKADSTAAAGGEEESTGLAGF